MKWYRAAMIDVRLATPDDAEVIARHRVAMFTDMGTLPPGADVEALRCATAAYLRDAIGSDYFGWLACDGGGSASCR